MYKLVKNEGNENKGESDKSAKGAKSRWEELPLRVLRQAVLSDVLDEEAPAHAHGRAPVPVQVLRPALLAEWRTAEPRRLQTQARDHVQVHILRQGVPAQRSAQDAPAHCPQ